MGCCSAKVRKKTIVSLENPVSYSNQDEERLTHIPNRPTQLSNSLVLREDRPFYKFKSAPVTNFSSFKLEPLDISSITLSRSTVQQSQELNDLSISKTFSFKSRDSTISHIQITKKGAISNGVVEEIRGQVSKVHCEDSLDPSQIIKLWKQFK